MDNGGRIWRGPRIKHECLQMQFSVWHHKLITQLRTCVKKKRRRNTSHYFKLYEFRKREKQIKLCAFKMKINGIIIILSKLPNRRLLISRFIFCPLSLFLSTSLFSCDSNRSKLIIELTILDSSLWIPTHNLRKHFKSPKYNGPREIRADSM